MSVAISELHVAALHVDRERAGLVDRVRLVRGAELDAPHATVDALLHLEHGAALRLAHPQAGDALLALSKYSPRLAVASVNDDRLARLIGPDLLQLLRQLAVGHEGVTHLRRAGQRLRAREQLRAARCGFDDLGARPWAEFAAPNWQPQARPQDDATPSTLDQLTPQEFKISLLVAQGKTNKEAAAELFLSPKTIEYHLRNAYRKLGVRTRKDLAEALAAD